MIRRIMRFSWLAATLLVPLILLSQTSQAQHTTTVEQSMRPSQTANPAQPTDSVAETAGSGFTDGLQIHIVDRLISGTIQDAAALTCRQRCEDEYNLCRKAGGTNSDCEMIENSCLSKCW